MSIADCRMNLPRAIVLAKTSTPRISHPTTEPPQLNEGLPISTENFDNLLSVKLQILLQFGQDTVYLCST